MSVHPTSFARELTADRRKLLLSLLEDDDIGTPVGVEPRPERASAPLSWQQERLWFLEQLDPQSSTFVLPIVLRLRGAVKEGALRMALNALAARHEVLRTRFIEHDGFPIQLIESTVDIELPVDDLQSTNPDHRLAEADRIGMQEIRKPFALEIAPLLRARLIRLAPADQRLVVAMHHMVSDGWSIGVFLGEIAALYGAILSGHDPDHALPPLNWQYGDFAYWQRNAADPDIAAGIAYWKAQLAGLPPCLQLPIDKIRPAEQTMRGSSESIVIDEQTTARIRSLAQGEGVTVFMFLIAVFQVLLYRYSEQEDIAVGTPVAGRTLPETEPLIGLFLNTIVIRGDLRGGPSFRTFLARIRETALSAYDHQGVPFERLVQEVQPVRDFSRSPIFQALFTLQVPIAQCPKGGWLEMALETLDHGSAKYDVTLHLQEEGSRITGYLECNADLFQRETIGAMAAHYCTLIASALEDPHESVAALQIMPAAERRKVLIDWNDTSVPLSPRATVQRLFSEQARRQPEATAVSCGSVRVTYRQLDMVSNQLARRIRSLNAAPGSLIGLVLERSVEIVIAALGILKAGCSYVPLDPDFPQERLAGMLEDSHAGLLVTQSTLAGLFPAYSGTILSIDLEEAFILSEDPSPLDETAGPGDLAYVIFTSGSTGKPKGVMITHGALANFLESMRREPGLMARDILLAVTTLSFDIAALEIYLPLVSGAQVVIATRETTSDGKVLAAEIHRSGATVMQATPATWRLLIESGWRGDRRLTALCGGEAMSREIAAALIERTGSVWNMYGPTETTIWSLVHGVRHTEGSLIPIGRPIMNTTAYIFDSRMQPALPGVAGELYLGGAGLARGYLGQPELTAASFIENPLPECLGERIYRTGDLARWRYDGTIECLGRNDNQVKIRGYRVELGEIESVLRSMPNVAEAVVVARQDPAGDKRLVAYLQMLAGTDAPSAAEARKFLQAKLPQYMVPAFLVPVQEFPKTANNKIDRKRLPEVERAGTPPSGAEFIAPRDELESQLAAIWSNVLGITTVGVRDNFFELGGHSLLAARVFAGIEKATGHHVPLATLFRAPDIERLAQKIRGGEWNADWSSVVELQRGTSSPFFCVHSLGANLVSYKKLAMLLDSTQQFYGLQPRGLSGEEEPHSSIPEMAEAYLAEIRRIQPAGPYFLGGVCLGGVVAYEMAQQVRAAGEEIGLLLLIDSEYPGDPPFQRVRDYGVFLADWHAGELMRLQPPQRWPYIREKAGKGFRRLSSRAPAEDSLSRAVEKIRAANLRALLAYRAQPYDGKVTLFWSSEAAARCYEDLRLAWSAVAEGGLEVHVIPGNHLTMVEPPHLALLASELNSQLAKARAQAKVDAVSVTAQAAYA